MKKNQGFDSAQARFPWINPHKFCSCGVQSLHHCLLLLGMPSDLSDLLGKCPMHQNIGCGHDVPLLTSLARSAGAKAENLTSTNVRALRPVINRSLNMGHPVILGSNPNMHWLVLAGFSGNGDYVWLDSANEELFGTWSWGEIKDWVGEGEAEYEALSIGMGKKRNSGRSMVPHISEIYGLLGSDEMLAGEWGIYLQDLDQVFNFKSGKGSEIDAETFFERNEDPIVQPVLWTEHAEEDQVREVFANYRTVANFHSLSVPARFETHAVAHMSLILRGSLS